MCAAARRRHSLAASWFSDTGDLRLQDAAQSRRFVASLTGTSVPSAGTVLAAGILHEVYHALIEAHGGIGGIRSRVEAAVDDGVLRGTLVSFTSAYPPREVYAGTVPASAAIEAAPESPLEELVLLRITNENPAMAPFAEFTDETGLGAGYPEITAAIERGERGTADDLLETLRAPARAHPESLAAQLAYVRDHFGHLIPHLMDRLLRTLDVIAEEAVGGVHGAGPPQLPDYGIGAADIERFSPHRDWMQSLVLIAKNTYVWLGQLAEIYRTEVTRLDQIPDEELDRLADLGFTGLWLIGIWERSPASQEIKRRRGDYTAVASAYAVYDYVVADDLGGDAALHNLEIRAGARGIRLAADMVPNHTGIDSRWVMEHPDWFIQLPEPPFPAYSYDGPDLSADDRTEIRIEDHYWDGSDAAVVFQRRDRTTGDTRYLYHGNDGTVTPWNDTAQLDFLNPEVREAVIQTILYVARRFSVIRFDAAMTLASQHIQRLWYPPPGGGGAIPSRAEHGLTQQEFEAALPHEFWREVVERVAVEVPDTLLLAEAFWLMESYFVRSIGMHRVYNSAFMHMTSKEDNAGLRTLIRRTLAYDARVLERFVNFMNNPDEEPAVVQYGDGDKYFGVALLMATLPGLPMFGHGQVEGLHEQYGMEFRVARWQEEANKGLVERHRRELTPFLNRRAQFASAEHFHLFDLVTGSGEVNQNVIAYSNRSGGAASLIVVNNAYDTVHGTIASSTPRKQASGELQRASLREALGLASATGVVTFRDIPAQLEYAVTTASLDEGLEVILNGYGYHGFVDFGVREGDDWRQLAQRLDGRGVPSLDAELAQQHRQPMREALATTVRLGDAIDAPAAQLAESHRRFVEQAGRFGEEADPALVKSFVAKMAALHSVDVARLLDAEDAVRAEELITPAARKTVVAAYVLEALRSGAATRLDLEGTLRDEGIDPEFVEMLAHAEDADDLEALVTATTPPTQRGAAGLAMAAAARRPKQAKKALLTIIRGPTDPA